MTRFLNLALALAFGATAGWCAPPQKKKAAPAKKAAEIHIQSTGYPDTVKADVFLTAFGNQVKTTPIQIPAESKVELESKIAKHYEQALKKFGFEVLPSVAPADWDKKASNAFSVGIDTSLFRMHGNDVKSMLVANEKERLSQITFIGNRDNGPLSGTFTIMCLAIEISEAKFNGPMATVVLTPTILIDADLKFAGGGPRLNGYLKPIYYNSERLRRDIVNILNENAPNRTPTSTQRLSTTASSVDRTLVSDMIDDYAKSCLYQFELIRDTWDTMCSQNQQSRSLPNDADVHLGLNGSYAEKSEASGIWGAALAQAAKNLREGGDPSESRAMIEKQSQLLTRNANALKDVDTTGKQSNMLSAGLVIAKIGYAPLLPKLKAILDALPAPQ